MTTSLELGLIHDRRFGSRFAPAAAEYARIADGRKAERPGDAALRQIGQERLMDGCFPLGSGARTGPSQNIIHRNFVHTA
jgi:hypothetical protein